MVPKIVGTLTQSMYLQVIWKKTKNIDYKKIVHEGEWQITCSMAEVDGAFIYKQAREFMEVEGDGHKCS